MAKKKEKPTPRMHCPDCGSDDRDVSEVNRDHNSMTEEVVCMHCGKAWLEHYTLILEEIEDE